MVSITGSKVKVAVIGAGAAGLCAAKHMSSEQHIFEFSVFEQQDGIGGTWRFTSKIGTDEHGLPIHSSMYENLRTNLPKEVMAFPDFPFPDCSGKSFVHHTDVLKYLEDYTDKYDLMRYIKFNTVVTGVQPLNPTVSDPKWLVQVHNVVTHEEVSERYDAVMVCNGHYSVPFIPELPGIETFKGILVHSHEYRNNSMFKDKKVVVLGAGASGIDIAIEVSAVANEVVLSHNLAPKTCPLPQNLTQEVGIRTIQKNSVTFLNNNQYSCDAIILCTGYLYTYNFLHNDCQMQIGNQRVRPLFKHLFHAYFPTLGIWAVPKQIVPFPIYDQQVIVFLKFLKGEITLPSKTEMLKDEDLDFQYRLSRGMKERHAHVMPGILQWDYDDQISKLGAIPPLPNALRKLFKHVHSIRKEDVLNYKKFNFKILDDENFEEL